MELSGLFSAHLTGLSVLTAYLDQSCSFGLVLPYDISAFVLSLLQAFNLSMTRLGLEKGNIAQQKREGKNVVIGAEIRIETLYNELHAEREHALQHASISVACWRARNCPSFHLDEALSIV
jgi:hypothetical protein